MFSRRLTPIAVPILAGLATVASAVPTSAATGSVVKTGNCSGTSVYSLQVQRETRTSISVDWGVDMRRHTKGIKWAVTEADNATIFVHTTVQTIADGSFSITRIIPSQPTNTITATATNPATGETCKATATI